MRRIGVSALGEYRRMFRAGLHGLRGNVTQGDCPFRHAAHPDHPADNLQICRIGLELVGGNSEHLTARLLRRLSPRERQVAYLYYFEDQSADEVGRALGIKPATVRVFLHRVVTKLRRLRPTLELKEQST